MIPVIGPVTDISTSALADATIALAKETAVLAKAMIVVAVATVVLAIATIALWLTSYVGFAKLAKKISESNEHGANKFNGR
jgi:tetrahydromethanopterin S-methyltransferase subunit C